MEKDSGCKMTYLNASNRKCNINPLYFVNYILCLISITPYLYRNLNRILMITVIISVLSLQLLVLFTNKTTRETRNATAWIWIWILYQVLLYAIGFSTSSIGNYMTILFFYCTALNGLIIYDLYDEIHIRRLAKFVCALVLFNLLDNIRLGVIYPNCNSYMYQSWGSNYLLMNVGGTEFDAAIMLLCGTISTCLFWYRKKMRGAIRNLAVIFCFLMLYYLTFISGRATSILLLCLMMLFAMFRGKNKILIPAAITILLLLILFSDVSAVSLISNERVASRLSDISRIISGNQIASDSSLAVRITKAQESFRTFLSTPSSLIFGIGNHDTLSEVTGIGHHSEIIDILPKYGVIGFLLFVLVILKIRNKIYSSDGRGGLVSFIYFFFVLYSFFNVSVYPVIGVVVFMLSPSLLSIILNKRHAYGVESGKINSDDY